MVTRRVIDSRFSDQVQVLNRLQLPYVLESGYVNLRCTYSIGCPNEINNTRVGHKADPLHPAEQQYGMGYRGLFQLPEEAPVPELVGVSCCAQFAVSRQAIQRTSKAEYEHYRTWLRSTTMSDDTSGRIMEYTWHSMWSSLSLLFPIINIKFVSYHGQRTSPLS